MTSRPMLPRSWFTLTVLVDTRGAAYEDLPCMLQPLAWDEDATATVKRNAAAVCLRQCPALLACRDRLDELGEQARGVWAGVVLPRRGDGLSTARSLIVSGVAHRRARPRTLPPLEPDVFHVVG